MSANSQPASPSYVAPTLPRRLVAMVYDTLLVLPLIMVSVAVAMGIHSALYEPPFPGTYNAISVAQVTGIHTAAYSTQAIGIYAVTYGAQTMAAYSAIYGEQTALLHPQLVQLLALLTLITFFCIFWRKNGQTLGMQAWRIKLVGSDGGKPGLGQCVIRCLGACLSALCLGLGYAWCLFDKRKRYWHDYLSSSELILLDSSNKKQKK
ncbi:MAG: RDD family protein [Parahaliea sp.]